VRITWVALDATIEPHTVTAVRGAIVAGYQVRRAGSGATLGYIYKAGSAWRWQTEDASAYGERPDQRLAVIALQSARGDARAPRQTTIAPDYVPPTDTDILTAWRKVSPAPAPGAAPKVSSAPSAPAPARILWPDDNATPDVTAALSAAFRKHERTK
jgi:hypothetical protein